MSSFAYPAVALKAKCLKFQKRSWWKSTLSTHKNALQLDFTLTKEHEQNEMVNEVIVPMQMLTASWSGLKKKKKKKKAVLQQVLQWWIDVFHTAHQHIQHIYFQTYSFFMEHVTGWMIRVRPDGSALIVSCQGGTLRNWGLECLKHTPLYSYVYTNLFTYGLE